jgi:ligand-binding SRPBCC domain-containing protein
MIVKKKNWEIWIDKPLEEVWSFFSRPENLNEITPEHVSFELLSDIEGVEMYEGMIIQYNIAPLLGIKMNWVTEITHIREKQYFIDEQRFGPYGFWHHQHWFEEKDGGTLMKDILHYKVPYGIIGNIANALFVEKMVNQIFDFREETIEKIWPSK